MSFISFCYLFFFCGGWGVGGGRWNNLMDFFIIAAPPPKLLGYHPSLSITVGEGAKDTIAPEPSPPPPYHIIIIQKF